MADQKKFWAPGRQFYDTDGEVDSGAVAEFAAAVLGRIEQAPVPPVAPLVDEAEQAVEFERRAPDLDRVGGVLRSMGGKPDTPAQRDLRRDTVAGRAVARQLAARDRERARFDEGS